MLGGSCAIHSVIVSNGDAGGVGDYDMLFRMQLANAIRDVSLLQEVFVSTWSRAYSQLAPLF